MFRSRLTVALALLALASVLQGGFALWALAVADRHAQHGRVTADIHLGFVELSATKQRLRTWVSQSLLGAGAERDERIRLQARSARQHRASAQAVGAGLSAGQGTGR